MPYPILKRSLNDVQSILKVCRQRKISRVVITDHNTIAGAVIAHQMDPDRVIIGEEIKTTQGEILAIYMKEEVPAGLQPHEAIARLRDQGAFISVSHPFDLGRSGAWGLDKLLRIAPLVDAIEIFNARCIKKIYNNLAQEFAYQHNLLGTAGSDAHSLMELGKARAVHHHHGLSRFSHISTAYVCGARRGEVPEEALSAEFGFSCAYEFSKYEGELLVQAAKKELPISVFRPGMIIGDSRTGEIKTFNSFYFPLKLYLAGVTSFLPANPDLHVNIVPVDYVAGSVVQLNFDPRAEGLNFHLTAPYES